MYVVVRLGERVWGIKSRSARTDSQEEHISQTIRAETGRKAYDTRAPGVGGVNVRTYCS